MSDSHAVSGLTAKPGSSSRASAQGAPVFDHGAAVGDRVRGARATISAAVRAAVNARETFVKMRLALNTNTDNYAKTRYCISDNAYYTPFITL